MSYQLEEFESWASKLLELEPYDEKKAATYNPDINQIIDHLNAFNHEQAFVSVALGEELVNHCIHLIPVTEEHLVTKFCSLMIHLLRKQNIAIGQDTSVSLCGYLIKAIRRCTQWAICDLLLAMSTFLFSNASQVHQFWEELIGDEGVISKYADPDDGHFTVEIRYYALRCIEYITAQEINESSLDLSRKCFSLFLKNLLVIPSNPTEDVLVCKLRCSCFIGLQNLVQVSKMSLLQSLGELLAVMKVHMFYGLPNQSQLMVTTCLYPSPLSQSHFSTEVPKSADVSNSSCKNSGHGSRSRKRRSTAKKVVSGENRVTATPSKYDDQKSADDRSPSQRNLRPYPIVKFSSSDSEFSDSDGGNIARLRSSQTRVRHCSLAALSNVVKMLDRKLMFGYWSSFLPDSPSSFGTLTTCFLKDPSPKVRCGALIVLSCMLEGSSPFLSLADERDKTKMAFTTLSSTVTSTVKELHRTLILALVAETSNLVLTQIIKCISLLVQSAPISKLSDGFLTKLSKQLKPFLFHKDSNVKVAALTSFGAIVGVKPAPLEIKDMLQWHNSASLACSSREVDNSTPKSWLIEVCLGNVCENEQIVPLPVLLESFQLLSLIVKEYFMIARFYLDFIKCATVKGLASKDLPIKLHSSKLLEELGRAMSQILDSEDSLKLNLSITEITAFWAHLLNTSLPQILQSPVDEINFHTLAIHGCNCISTIGGEAFSFLQVRQQIFCQTVLIGLSTSDNKNVKAAAIRGLGILILFPCLQEDESFLLDVLDKIVLAMEDTSLEVRLKAAWALGNLTDVLVSNDKSLKGHLDCYQLSDNSIKQLIAAAIKGSNDSDRIASNGVRALGNLLRFLNKKHIEDESFTEIIKHSVDALMSCASSRSTMKVRWNACYAISNMLKNAHLNLKEMTWRCQLFQLMVDLAKSCKNFKVRISAVISLGVPARREDYGNIDDMVIIWKSLTEGLLNIQTSINFVEYQHSDHLADQICATLCHLISLMEFDDVKPVFNCLTEEILEALKCYFTRYSTRQGNHKTFDEVSCNVQTALDKLEHLKRISGELIVQEYIDKLYQIIIINEN